MFSEIFVQLLEKTGATAYKLSKDTGISQGMISNWRSGNRMPSAENLIALADYFGVSVDYLLGRDANERTKSPGMEDSMPRDEQERELIRLARQADSTQKAIALQVLKLAVEHEKSASHKS